MGIVAAFSLVIYYWAQASKLPKAEMEVLINRQAGGQTEAKALGEA
jgi:hypothetical protein